MLIDHPRVTRSIMYVTTESATVASPARPRLCVALCEPDAPLKRLFCEWLTGAGLEPVPCSGSAHGAPALVVADVPTPRVDAAARIAALRARFPGARVLAISGYFITSGATAAAARELGADALLAKPFPRKAFTAAVAALL
jgi:DNA-binding response OmpR family regulator